MFDLLPEARQASDGVKHQNGSLALPKKHTSAYRSGVIGSASVLFRCPRALPAGGSGHGFPHR